MPTHLATTAAGRAHLEALLLDYLQAIGPSQWPGADAIVQEDVLASYAQALSAGLVPSRRELLERHPELAAEVDAWFVEHPSSPFLFGAGTP